MNVEACAMILLHDCTHIILQYLLVKISICFWNNQITALLVVITWIVLRCNLFRRDNLKLYKAWYSFKKGLSRDIKVGASQERLKFHHFNIHPKTNFFENPMKEVEILSIFLGFGIFSISCTSILWFRFCPSLLPLDDWIY